MKILVKACIGVVVIFITLICKRQHGGDYQFRSDSGSFAAIFLMGALARGGGEVINILLSPATNFHCISININQYWHDLSNLIPAMRWFFKLSKTFWKNILIFSNQIMDGRKNYVFDFKLFMDFTKRAGNRIWRGGAKPESNDVKTDPLSPLFCWETFLPPISCRPRLSFQVWLIPHWG